MPRGGSKAGSRPNSGRKAKPLADHVAEGTHRKDRHGPANVKGEGMVRGAGARRPPMPTGLDARMKTAWRTLLDDLEAAALLDIADAPLYEAFAVAFGRAREARALIKKHGMLVAGARDGTLVANPMIRVERESLQLLRQLADQLAVGMRTRASLGMAIVRGARKKETEEPDAGAARASGIGPSPRLRALEGGKR